MCACVCVCVRVCACVCFHPNAPAFCASFVDLRHATAVRRAFIVFGAPRAHQSVNVRAPLEHEHEPDDATGRPHGVSNADTATAENAEALIRQFWSLAADGAFSDTLQLFAEDAQYYDMLYARPFIGVPAIARHPADM